MSEDNAQKNLNARIKILIAEDNDVSREMMTSILKTQGYTVIGVTDGGAAMDASVKEPIDLALVDINMAPQGGFEYVRFLLARSLKIPVVIITGDDSSDILMEANSLGIIKVLHKPVTPDRLISTVKRVLEKKGISTQPIASTIQDSRHSSDDLMRMAVNLAHENTLEGRGGPFGAIVSDAEGRILGRGVNGIKSRVDPTAHAEVMAIRQAADKLGQADLSDCILYCSSEPTMMGKALIVSVGIKSVYYGLSHEDIKAARKMEDLVRAELEGRVPSQTQYVQKGFDEALAMYRDWAAQQKFKKEG